MKVTVCELNNDPDIFLQDWEQLILHLKTMNSDLVLLPEMPFCHWFASSSHFSSKIWEEAVIVHDKWIAQFKELSSSIVLGSRPVNSGNKRLNEGFVWEKEDYRAAHAKYYLPDCEGFWEATWYDRGNGDFTPVRSSKGVIGFMICTEIWFMEHARAYGKKGVHLIANPRATKRVTLEKWLVGGRAAAVVSGAFCLSSNLVTFNKKEADLGGQGWVIGPNGEVIALTSQEQPFVTVEIDLSEAEYAKQTYPRSVVE